ncbi:MAG: hypothetical protein WCI79_03295 [Candidatus Saccharibacteria bacterium]
MLFWVIIAVVLIFGVVVFRGSPYVPSQKRYLRQALTELYKVSGKDVLIDIGSGDGVVLREAARLGARAVGYEINPLLVVISKLLSHRYKKIKVNLADFWRAKLPDDTTVIYVFSVTRDVNGITKRLQSEVNRLGHKVSLISYGSEFESLKLVKKSGAYFLHTVSPLQPDKAQV